MKNYYQILGVPPTATKSEIKSAYHKLSKKIHPDVNNGDEFFTGLFKNINEAYQVLIDDARRKAFQAEADNLSADFDFIREKERILHQKEAALVHRQIRRKLFIRGSVSLVAGLVVIALFSLSFDERSEPKIVIHHSQRVAEVNISDTVNTASATTPTAPLISLKPNMKQLFDAQKSRSIIAVDGAVREKKALLKESVVPEITHASPRELNSMEMNEILHLVEHDKISKGNISKCIRLCKSANSNVENAFELARFLQAKGYVIAGREASSQATTGVRIDCDGKIISLTIGLID